jgi:hypothetical protein
LISSPALEEPGASAAV